MSLLAWTIPLACATPYVPWFAMAAAKRQAGGYDNHDPRGQTARLEGWGKRAVAAHQNSFEVLPPFLAAALLAVHTGVDASPWAGPLGVAWVALRCVYAAMYLADRPRLRSLSFDFGLVIVASLFFLSLLGGSAPTAR